MEDLEIQSPSTTSTLELERTPTLPLSGLWGTFCKTMTMVGRAGNLTCTQRFFSDKKIMGLGFGSKIGGVVSQCFPLNGNARNPYCKGVDGLVDSYMDTLKSGTKQL